MKSLIRILSLFFCIFAFSSLCEANKFCKIKIGDPTGIGYIHGYSVLEHLSSTFIYKDKSNYIVTTTTILPTTYSVSPLSNQVVTGIAVFSSDKQLLFSNGIELIDDENIEQFIGKSIRDVKVKYGNLHCEIGSGCYVPSYVTKRATIVSFIGKCCDNDDNPIECIEGITHWEIIENRFRECKEHIKPVRIRYRKSCNVL